MPLPLPPLFGQFIAVWWGAVWGSFANVCVHRIPRGGSLAWPGSHCPACGEPIAWYDNVPVLSYAVLGGRCRICKTRISARYPILEALVAGLSLVLWQRHPGSLAYLAEFAFVLSLVVMSAIDLELKIIPDALTLPGIPVFFAAGFAIDVAPWPERLGGAVLGYALVWLLARVYEKLRGRAGLGLGDGKLLAVVAAFLGARALPWVIIFGSLQGLLVTVPLLSLARRRGHVRSVARTEVPFGPFLALGTLEVLLIGPERLATSVLALLSRGF